MVTAGILGLKVENEHLSLSPNLPDFIHNLDISGLKYHNATISVHMIGKGCNISYCKINGKKVKNILIDENAMGIQNITIFLK